MGEVATSIGLQAVVGAIARMGDAAFDLPRTITALAETAQVFTGATGVAFEPAGAAFFNPGVAIGEIKGVPRRVPVVFEGTELGFLAIYGAAMFGPATADRTQVIADLAALACGRAKQAAERAADRRRPAMDDARYRLINGVGLNLRNTLGAASGYMQLVEMEGSLTLPQQEHVLRARRAIGAATSLIADLLDLARADAGKLSFEREPVNMNALAREAVRKHRDAADAKKCSIEMMASERGPVIITDPSHVQDIVEVLVYNAVRYTPEDGKVTIRVEIREGRRGEDPEKWVCLSVSDTGPGLKEADRVFEEVARVEQSRGNVRFKLAICRRVARLLGGDLMLDTSETGGSTFTLWLPLPVSR